MTGVGQKIKHFAQARSKKLKEQIKENLSQVLITKKELDHIKENLAKMIDAMAHNPSFLSRASLFWGERPLWHKIIAGIVLIIPTFVVAVLMHIPVLLAISIFTLVIYTLGSMLLDNHHYQNLNRTEHLKTGISGLATHLGTVIISLGALRKHIKAEIERFQKENDELSSHVTDLEDEIQKLEKQGGSFSKLEQELRDTIALLQEKEQALFIQLKEKTELLANTLDELARVKQEYEHALNDVSQKNMKLMHLSHAHHLELDKEKQITATLQGALETMCQNILHEPQEQQRFRDKLEAFLSNKEASFHLIAERISKAERELSLTNQKLKHMSELYEQSLARSEEHIEHKFRQLTSAPVLHAQALSLLGLHARPTQQEILEEPLHADTPMH